MVDPDEMAGFEIFYVEDGERIGPMSFEDFVAKLDELEKRESRNDQMSLLDWESEKPEGAGTC